METRIELVDARTARAKVEGDVLRIRMPRHWPQAYQDQTVAKFRRWAVKHEAAAVALPSLEDWDGRRWGEQEFGAYVRRINDETLRAPLKGVRIGTARRTRLAQCNTQTGVMTFSRYAIDGMPERALRYLVLHELAHLFEANHSARFWAHVAAHEPDYKRQRTIAQAHHARMADTPDPDRRPVAAAGAVVPTPAVSAPRPTPVPRPDPAPVASLPPAGPDPDGHPFGSLFAFIPTR